MDDHETQAGRTPAADGDEPPTAIRWVAVDTNLYGGGNVRLDDLEKLAAELAVANVEVLIHTSVAWEWAEHAYEALEEARVAAQRRRSDVEGAWLHRRYDLDFPSTTIEDITDHLEESLRKHPNVRVIAMSPAAATAGLRAQILQVGAGKRKKGTKTGAADTAAAYDTISYVQSTHEPIAELVALSRDSDVEDAYSTQGVEIRRFADPTELLEIVRNLLPVSTSNQDAQDNLAERFTLALARFLKDARTARERLGVNLESDVRGILLPELPWIGESQIVYFSGLARVDGVKYAPEFERDGTRLVSGLVVLTADIRAWHDQGGRNELWTGNDFSIALRVTATETSAGEITEFRALGAGSLIAKPKRYFQPKRAVADLSRALAKSPLPGGQDLWTDILLGTRTTGLPTGLSVRDTSPGSLNALDELAVSLEFSTSTSRRTVVVCPSRWINADDDQLFVIAAGDPDRGIDTGRKSPWFGADAVAAQIVHLWAIATGDDLLRASDLRR